VGDAEGDAVGDAVRLLDGLAAGGVVWALAAEAVPYPLSASVIPPPSMATATPVVMVAVLRIGASSCPDLRLVEVCVWKRLAPRGIAARCGVPKAPLTSSEFEHHEGTAAGRAADRERAARGLNGPPDDV